MQFSQWQQDRQPIPISAAMFQEKYCLPKIRACVDFWAEWLKTHKP
jgi:hypothetical protein